MAKKKPAVAKKASGRKTTVRKKVVKKKAAAKRQSGRATAKKKAAGKKTVRRKMAAKKSARRGTARSVKKKAKRPKSLGRPRLPADAQLDLVFQKDYQAREIFAFLGVETVRELEAYGPDEIIERLAGPVIQTVGRIRKALALSNRCLAGDLDFAIEFQAKLRE